MRVLYLMIFSASLMMVSAVCASDLEKEKRAREEAQKDLASANSAVDELTRKSEIAAQKLADDLEKEKLAREEAQKELKAATTAVDELTKKSKLSVKHAITPKPRREMKRMPPRPPPRPAMKCNKPRSRH